MKPQFDIIATDQQRADMATFRAYVRKKYTQEQPTAQLFADTVNLLTNRLSEYYWSRQDVTSVMDYLVESAWSFTSPGDFVLENAERFVKVVQSDETSLSQLHISGFFDVPIPLAPVHNDVEYKTERQEQSAHLSLMVRLQRFGQLPQPDFKQSIHALRKGKKHFPRPYDN